MSIIYVPRLIETAEQVEALPEGTFVPRANGRLPKKRKDGTWGDLWGDCGLFDVMGYTAFVPIEAEEEYSTERAGLAWDNDAIYSSPEDVRRDGWTDPLQRRYVTPWESA